MIFFLYGPDDFRAKEKIKELKNKFRREIDQSDTSLAELSGQDLGWEKFHATVSANSLFARRRLVVVENVLLNKDRDFLSSLAEYLKTKSASQNNILIFYESAIIMDKHNQPQIVGGDNNKPLTKSQGALFSFLKNTPYAQYFKALDNQAAVAWVKARLAEAGLEIDYQARQILVSFIGNDLWALNNEVNKLISYQSAFGDAHKLIKEETVLLLSENQLEENIFALTDALSNKNKSLALKLLEEQLRQGVNEVYLLTMLLRQIKILLSVRAALDSGLEAKKIGALIKVHPYVLQKSLSQARNFNLEALKNIFNALIRLDYNYKSGKLPAPLMMTVLLANI